MKNKILIVDDESDICEMISTFMEGNGIDTATAPGGAEALQVLGQDNAIGLVITDWNMEGMKGDELIACMRRDGYDMPVIMITGFSPLSEEEALEAGAIALYLKPLEMKELCEAAREALASAQKPETA